MAEKKNPDYSASAVNLCNPPEVKDLLFGQLQRLVSLEDMRMRADSYIPAELKAEIAKLEAEIVAEDKGIRGYIDTFGSFQDIEAGHYAVKQRRESITYQPTLVRRNLPENVAAMVIVETVDTKKIDGMVKGGFITTEDAKKCGEVKEMFAYIIK